LGDLGCGSGTFAKALIELLPAGSHITAVDASTSESMKKGLILFKPTLNMTT